MQHTDKITLKNMKFYGYHGVFPEEREQGQYFYIDVEMFCSLKKAGDSDELEDTVDYGAVFGIVRNITENNKFRLIERLAEAISQEILSRFDEIQEILVRVRKPEAPIDGELDWAEIELKRTRNVK